MTVASLELCKELYELSGWGDTHGCWYESYAVTTIECWPWQRDHNYRDEGYHSETPAYDLSYLLRKLPKTRKRKTAKQSRTERLNLSAADDGSWVAGYLGHGFVLADTPEDAACDLAIELFKKGVLVKEEV